MKQWMTKAASKRVLAMILALTMVLSCFPGISVHAEQSTKTVYFQNNWNWTDVCIHYWGADFGTSWPGEAMTMIDTLDSGEVYQFDVPADATGIIFNGLKDDGSGNRDQSPDITEFAHGDAFQMAWNDGNQVVKFAYTPPAQEQLLYLKPNENWRKDGARFAAYFFGNGEIWRDMTDLDGDGYYEVAVPEGYTSVIFCRMNSNLTENNWDNKWNQSADITIPTDGTNCFTMADGIWEKEEWNGTWSVYPPAEPEPTASYYVAGSEGLCGNAWVVGDSNNQMTLDENDGLWKKVYPNVAPGSYELKVNDGTWDNSWGASGGGNYLLSVEAVSNVTITFDEANGVVDAIVEAIGTQPDPEPEPEPTEGTVIFHFTNNLSWSNVNLYTWMDDVGTYTGEWPGTALAEDENGWFSAAVNYPVVEGKSRKFIFNSGSAQTADLEVPAGATEIWVELADQADGKYQANIQTTPIITSPVVQGTSVTFRYYSPEASAVEVRGDFNDWGSGTSMEKDAYGIWSVRVDDLTPGTHEYKFLVDGEWMKDPENDQTQGDNSAFFIVDPALDINEITIHIHYTRADGIYDNWNVFAWDSQGSEQLDLTVGAGEAVTTVVLEGRSAQKFQFKLRKSIEGNEWADQGSDMAVDLSKIVSGTIDVYVSDKNEFRQVNGSDVITANKISDIQLDYENNRLIITTIQAVRDPATAFSLIQESNAGLHQDVELTLVKTSGTSCTYALSQVLDLVSLYQFKVFFNEEALEQYRQIPYDISIDQVYATEKFAQEFTYDGDDLGAFLEAAQTTFRLWAPTAEAVAVKLYSTGSDSEPGAADLGSYEMTAGDNGTWSVTVGGDLKNIYYTYSVTVDGKMVETIDPYAQAAGVNGKRAMVVDLDSTDPEGWDQDTNPNPITSYTDAVIYELHVRDFSIDDSSGVSDRNQGKFLAFTEKGTTVNAEGDISTGIDYLENLGVTHLHLLPIYDYASVDETKCDTFNWGYDPQNYNVPEGSYSTNPYDGNVRINEMKQMVQSLHESGISVIMDVVYNHVYDSTTFSFNQIVPDYFSRVDSNRSGCGNDTASEREMVRKYIVDSVLYWAEEYHIDGFRFDLVGLLDVETINQIVTEVHAIRPDVIFYGEGWDMDSTNKEPGTEMAKQGNADKTPGFAYFSDSMRNLLAGNNGQSLGFVSGQSGVEGDVVSNFQANPWWTSDPTQVVQYASCHDNYTLIDKLVISTGSAGLTEDIKKMSNLSAAIYLTAQGIPFIHAGEEFFREKLEEDGGRCENSYNASDFVNHIEWSNLKDEDYAANAAWYAGLISFRQAHSALRLDTAEEIRSRVIQQQASDKLVSFWVNGKGVEGETHDSIYLIFNANTAAKTVQLPAGNWDVCVTDTQSGTETIQTVSGTVEIPAIGVLVLVQETTEQGPEAPAAKSNVALTGDFNGWNHSNYMDYANEDKTIVTTTMAVAAGTYGFKVKQDNTWYSTETTIVDAVEGLKMDGSIDPNAIFEATGGTYTFTFDTQSAELTVTKDSEGGDFGDPNEYFLCGWINNGDVADERYAFDENGQVTVTFDCDSYVYVRNGDHSEEYYTDGWLGSVSSATMYNTKKITTTNTADKLMIPGNVEVTLTMVRNNDDTITLSYATNTNDVVDGTGIQDGVTLHCWNWSFEEIEKNMALIAQQGYTAIQTSPVQPLKEATNVATSTVGGHWWVYYQPVDFVITTDEGNALGTKTELESMIQTAHEYGVQVIVDVVANHLANQTGNNLSEAIPDYLRAEEYWHDITKNTSDYSNRYEVTQMCMGGLPDLNTANKELQGYVLAFLKECIDIGVDGFRFDAAKHIETPKDQASFASDFWPTIIGGAETYALETQDKDLYLYGELLDTIDGLSVNAYTEYMAVTDNSWGNTLRSNVAAGNAAMSAGYNRAVDPDVLVVWAESHDTFADDSSSGVSEEDIIKTWALVAARADSMGLYLARPERMDQALGVASVTGWASDVVKAINVFDKAFVDAPEHIANEDGVSYVERGTSGVVLVQVSGEPGEVAVTAHTMADGTYVDQITGNIFQVEGGVISGTIGASGVAVVSAKVEETEYPVCVNAQGNGSVSASHEMAAQGTKVELTAVAAADSHFVEWTSPDVTIQKDENGQWYFMMPSHEVTIHADFVQHSFENAKPNGDGTHTGQCTCGVSVTQDCSGGEADCQNPAQCDHCGQSYGETDAQKHASEDFTYTSNDNDTHTKAHACCGQVLDSAQKHTFSNRVCIHCGQKQTSSWLGSWWDKWFGKPDEPTEPTVHTHSMTHVEAKEAGCTTDGNTEYWHCDGCGKYFSDPAGETEISSSATVIKAHGHSYGSDNKCIYCGQKKPASWWGSWFWPFW